MGVKHVLQLQAKGKAMNALPFIDSDLVDLRIEICDRQNVDRRGQQEVSNA